jgi:predicted RNA-binding protein with PUA-like domain
MKPKEKKYWLMKSEPSTYGIEHLKKDKKTAWTGIRNFLARNYMRQMSIGDEILFYHSSCPIPGVYGVAKVASKPYPDPTQFDPKSEYFEKRATKEKPVWDLVDIQYVSTLKNPVPLTELKSNKKFANMKMFKESRLSVTLVSPTEFSEISRLGSS